jgi:hypothetical protein
MCCKDVIVGLAVGMVAGYVLRGVPSVKKATEEIKSVIEKDLVNPIKDFISHKSSNCDCQKE